MPTDSLVHTGAEVGACSLPAPRQSQDPRKGLEGHAEAGWRKVVIIWKAEEQEC